MLILGMAVLGLILTKVINNFKAVITAEWKFSVKVQFERVRVWVVSRFEFT